MRKLLFQSIFRGPLTEKPPALDEAAVEELATALQRAARRRLGRSLSIREIDAGSCNGCELEIPGTNLSCDPRPEMGHCLGRLRTGWRMFRQQLRGRRRGLANRSCRPSYSRLPTAARYDFAGTPRPARSNDQNRRFDLRLWRPLRLFQAGLIAGCVQAGLVCVMTPMVMVFAQYRDHDPGSSGRSPAVVLIAFLPLIYVTLAAGGL
jgi:hypothetical protein